MNRRYGALLVALLVLAAGCRPFFPDRLPKASAPPNVRRTTFEVVARDNQCEPSVLAADRDGRGLLLTFRVTSVGKQHVFLIPDLNVRQTIPAGTEVSIPVLADRSGIYQYGCTGLPWLGFSDAKGKLAIK
jgi:Cupredoxin-like domain